MSASPQLREVLQETLRSVLGDQPGIAAAIAVRAASEIKKIMEGVGNTAGSEIFLGEKWWLHHQVIPTGIFHVEAPAGAEARSDDLCSALCPTRHPPQ